MFIFCYTIYSIRYNLNQYIKLSKIFLLNIILFNFSLLSSIITIERRNIQKELREIQEIKEANDLDYEIDRLLELDLLLPENINNHLDCKIKHSLDIYFEILSKKLISMEYAHGKLFLYDTKKIFTEIKEMTSFSIYNHAICNEKKELIGFWITSCRYGGWPILHTLISEETRENIIIFADGYTINTNNLKEIINKTPYLLVNRREEMKKFQDAMDILILEESITNFNRIFSFFYTSDGICLLLLKRDNENTKIAREKDLTIGIFHPSILPLILYHHHGLSNNPNINEMFSETDCSSQLSNNSNNPIKRINIINQVEWSLQKKELFIGKRQEWLLRQGVDLTIENQSDPILKEAFHAIDSRIKKQLHLDLQQVFGKRKYEKELYYQNYLKEVQNIVEAIEKMSDLFIDTSRILCNGKSKSMTFAITDCVDGKKYLSYLKIASKKDLFILNDHSRDPCGFIFSTQYKIDLRILRKKISKNHSLLIIEEDSIVEIKKAIVKKVIEHLDTLIYYEIKNCSLCLKSNGILLRVKENIIPNLDGQVGLFDIKTFEETFTIPMSAMEIIDINYNDNPVLEKKKEEAKKEEEKWISI